MKKILFFLLCVSIKTQAFELSLPVLYDRGVSPRTEEQKKASYIAYDVLKESQENVHRLHSLTNLGESDLWYVFSRIPIVYGVNVSKKSIIGKWPLPRWPHLYYPKILLSTYASIGAEEWEFGKPIYSGPLAKSLGCFNKNPLRYGTIFDGEEKEIVLFLNDQFIVFSPRYERIVFAEIMDNSDWMSAGETNALIERNGLNETPQFASQLIADNTAAAEPGMRFYSKLFVGDFDDDGSADILVWRKYYKTNLKDNDVAGFALQNSQWQHYERDLAAQEQTGKGVTGEYLPQETLESTIRQWLAGNNLTWKKGFPNMSECSGGEGKLIPEMHDPLLNDPDVIQ